MLKRMLKKLWKLWIVSPTTDEEVEHRELLRKYGLFWWECLESLRVWPKDKLGPKDYNLSPQQYEYLRTRQCQPILKEWEFRRAFRLICAIRARGLDWREYVDKEMERRGLE